MIYQRFCSEEKMEDTFTMYPSNDFIDLGIYQLGLEHCSSGHSFGPASRNHFLFHYVISGYGMLMAPNTDGIQKTYHLSADEGFMLLPGHITHYVADEHLPWTYMWVEFDGLRASESLGVAGFSRDNPIYRSTNDTMRSRLKEEMLFMVTHANESPIHEMIGHLFLFLDALVRSVTSAKVPPKNRLRNFYVREAVTYIEEHYAENISIEQIAGNCGLNRSYFGKIFKEEIGDSPQRFLLNYRLVKACELLRHTDMLIADIAPQVGYDNQLHFSRAFKGIYGISPRQWRNTNHA